MISTHPPLVVASESRTGRHYVRNYDRCVVDERVPLFAVIDSECDDGTAGDIVSTALLDARPHLVDAVTSGPDAVLELLIGTLLQANARILAIPKGRAGHGGGAAVTVCSCSKQLVVVAHVGDCRLYALERGAWVRKTTDHTLREEKRRSGYMPPDLNAGDSDFQVGIVVRAVGIMETLNVDIYRFSLGNCSSVLLCTRGAWLPIDPNGDGLPLPTRSDDTEIAEFMWRSYANNGERDNATIVVARLNHVAGPINESQSSLKGQLAGFDLDAHVLRELQAGSFDAIRELFALRVANGEMMALVQFGSLLTLSRSEILHGEGVELLRKLADEGNGCAAHNLAVALSTGPDGHSSKSANQFRHYMQIAADSGFEATVCSDPLWWRRSPTQR